MDEFPAKIDPQALLDQARNGCDRAIARLLDHYRPYLAMLARLRATPELQAKFDESDLVQETLVHVQKGLPQFRGTTEAEWTAWLRRIMASVSGKLMRHYTTQRRDAFVERRLEDEFDQSSQMMGQALMASESSPSARSSKRERAVILSRALTQLPADYREALILHRLEGLSMAEVAQRMGRSVDSVQKLLARGLIEMRRLLEGQL